MSIKKAFILIILIILSLIGYQIYKLNMNIRKQVDHNALPFEKMILPADIKILVMGDSTAVGTGSLSQETSTAGWFAKDFPNGYIENISQNGLKLAGLKQKLSLIKRSDYDLAVIQIGANDIMRLTPLNKIDEDVRFVLIALRKVSRNIVILHSGDVGAAPLFIWPFNWVLTKRSYDVRDIYKKAALDTGATYVDLIRINAADPVFSSNPQKYYALDGLHLNGEGYYMWYKSMRLALDENGVLLKGRYYARE